MGLGQLVPGWVRGKVDYCMRLCRRSAALEHELKKFSPVERTTTQKEPLSTVFFQELRD